MKNYKITAAELKEKFGDALIPTNGSTQPTEEGVYLKVSEEQNKFGGQVAYWALESDIHALNAENAPVSSGDGFFAEAAPATTKVKIKLQVIGSTGLTENEEEVTPASVGAYLSTGTLTASETSAVINDFNDIVELNNATTGIPTVLYVKNKTGN